MALGSIPSWGDEEGDQITNSRAGLEIQIRIFNTDGIKSYEMKAIWPRNVKSKKETLRKAEEQREQPKEKVHPCRESKDGPRKEWSALSHRIGDQGSTGLDCCTWTALLGRTGSSSGAAHLQFNCTKQAFNYKKEQKWNSLTIDRSGLRSDHPEIT